MKYSLGSPIEISRGLKYHPNSFSSLLFEAANEKLGAGGVGYIGNALWWGVTNTVLRKAIKRHMEVLDDARTL